VDEPQAGGDRPDDGRTSTVVLVPPERLVRWVEGFRGRHGATALAVVGGALTGAAEDGSMFLARLPFAASYDGLPDAGAFAAAAAPPDEWGLLLVRKGGFAVGRLVGAAIVDSKVGQRHVQSRSAAGGWSQQRFARRREAQAKGAYAAAADHAARLLTGLGPVVTGGDRAAVAAVLLDRRLEGLRVVEPWLPVPDPRRSVLESAVGEACSARISVVNA